MVTIFGKDACPYTQAALDDYRARGPVEYVNVIHDEDGMARMLTYTRGKRRVPVIVKDEKVTIGYGGT